MFSGICGARVRVYGSLAAIALAVLLLSFFCILFWNGIACVRAYRFQEGELEPKFDGSRAEEYLKQAGSRYTDEEILKKAYDYLMQENPQQTTEEFLTALVGIGEEAPQ